MDHFHYVDGRLHCEATDLVALAERTGTPAYVYSRATFEHHFHRFTEAFAPLRPLVCYSVKSCSNLAILRLLCELGAGLDVVSGGELHRARLSGCPPERVVFAGVGKTTEEIREALGECGPDHRRQPPIGLFNIESEAELENLAAIAEATGRSTCAALRVNPDVDPHTHRHTTTGLAENKFGVDLDHARRLFERHASHSRVRVTGIHLHLGSPIVTTSPYVEAIEKVLCLIDDLAARGIVVDTLDIGGGFAADYHRGGLPIEGRSPSRSPFAAEYAAAIVPLLRARVERGALRVVLEPGRFISANAGALLTRVQYVKVTPTKRFVICDAGMHTLIRPALYEAAHLIWPASVATSHEPVGGRDPASAPGFEVCDVVGPICESSDVFCQDRHLPPISRGDLIAIFTAGAYGMSMASRYNSHPLPCEVLVDQDEVTTIRRRETYDDLVRHEC